VSHILRFTTWLLFFLFNFYSISPIYIVQISSDGTGRQLPHTTCVEALTNKTFHLPGIEEMNGEFHHHDSQGNNMIRIVKKRAVTRAAIDLRPLLMLDFGLSSESGHNGCSDIHTRRSEINRDYRQRAEFAFYPNISGHSPPSLLS
jgi:hypothetical protein